MIERTVEQIGEPGGVCMFIETYAGRTGNYCLVNEGGDTLATGTLQEMQDEAERITAAETSHASLPHDFGDPEAKW